MANNCSNNIRILLISFQSCSQYVYLKKVSLLPNHDKVCEKVATNSTLTPVVCQTTSPLIDVFLDYVSPSFLLILFSLTLFISFNKRPQTRLSLLPTKLISLYYAPPRGPNGRGVADRQRGGCISILWGFLYLNRVLMATMVTIVTTITTVTMVTIVHRVTIVTLNSLVTLVFMVGIVTIVFCMYS